VWGLLLCDASHGGASSQNSLLVHDLYRRVCEPQLLFVAVNAVVLVHFVLTIQTCSTALQVERTICFGIVSDRARSSVFYSAHVFCVFFLCLDFNLLLKTFSRILKLVSCLHVLIRKLSSEFTTFIVGSAFSVYS
jgi:hypothetical protein